MSLATRFALLACVVIAGSTTIPFARAGGAPNPGVLPRGSKPYGATYEEWAVEYRRWLSGIPAATNPALDTTGEFCDQEQSGPVWFLASVMGASSVERECEVPPGKALYVPLIGVFAWGPDDLEDLVFLLEFVAGVDTSDMSDEDVLRGFANWIIDGVVHLSLTVDGVAYEDLFSYRAESPAFETLDTDLYDDLGAPFSQPNVGVTDGFALILAPLPPGKHTIEIVAAVDHPLLPGVTLGVSYDLTVRP